jgi:hypothetical protein
MIDLILPFYQILELLVSMQSHDMLLEVIITRPYLVWCSAVLRRALKRLCLAAVESALVNTLLMSIEVIDSSKSLGSGASSFITFIRFFVFAEMFSNPEFSILRRAARFRQLTLDQKGTLVFQCSEGISAGQDVHEFAMTTPWIGVSPPPGLTSYFALCHH